MIKGGAIFLINIYQDLFSPVLKMIVGSNAFCRFDETCSAYTKRKINEEGVLKGIGQGAMRILKCQPLTS